MRGKKTITSTYNIPIVTNIVKTLDGHTQKKLYIKTSNPAFFKGMERNKKYWELTTENNNVEAIKKQNQKLKDDKKDNGMKLRKESVTKGYKYIGKPSTDDLSIIRFKSEVYKDISQAQISLF